MRLSIIDYAFLQMETIECPSHVAGLMIFEIPKDFEGNFVKTLKERLLKQTDISPPFNMKLKQGGLLPAWPEWVEDTNFDLKFHLRHSALPAPGTQQDLLELANRLHARQLDRAHPLWEMYLIEGLEGNRFAVYLKIHHAVVDGVGAVAITERVLSEEADSTKALAIWNPRIQKPAQERADKNLLESLLKPSLKLVETALATPGAIYSMAGPATGFKKTRAGGLYRGSRTIFSAKINSSRSFGFNDVSLPEIKAASKALGVTINDVFLGLCSGAIGKYLDGRGEPASPTFSAMVPVALPKKEGQTSNKISALLIRIYTQIKDPIKRIEAIRESAEDAKADFQSMSPAEMETATFLTQSSLALMSQFGLADKTPPAIGLVISNVPGLKTKRYLMGAELKSNYPMSMLPASGGLNITVVSYADRFQFGLLTTPEIAPDIQIVADSIVDEFEELKKLLRKAAASDQKEATPAQKPPASGKVAAKKAAKKRPAAKKAKANASSAKPASRTPAKKASKPTAKKSTAKKPVARKSTAVKAAKPKVKSTSLKKTGVRKTSVKKTEGTRKSTRQTSARK